MHKIKFKILVFDDNKCILINRIFDHMSIEKHDMNFQFIFFFTKNEIKEKDNKLMYLPRALYTNITYGYIKTSTISKLT